VSLFDLIGGILGKQQGASSGVAQVLTQLLAGQGNAGQDDAAGQGNTQGMAGGLAGLVDQFRQAGLGHIAESWIGTGSNHPVSPDQLERVFGEQQVGELAEQSGMEKGQFLSQLSHALPAMVDRMTPNGRVPEDDGTISV
jgi:uncharacterized protein YidB (DUF937 family)